MLDLPLTVDAPPELLVLAPSKDNRILRRDLVDAVDVQQVALCGRTLGRQLRDFTTRSDVLPPERLDGAAPGDDASCRGNGTSIFGIKRGHGRGIASV